MPEQPKYARGEAFGLAQGKVEDKPEHQHHFDRGVRIPGLTAGRGPPRRLPAGDGGLVQPECQVAAPLQTSLVSRPVLDLIAGLRDAVTARGIVLERHARDRNGSAAAGPPAPAPGGSLHQRYLLADYLKRLSRIGNYATARGFRHVKAVDYQSPPSPFWLLPILKA